ncbi:MAG: glycosyltransferase [Caldilineaceae bacterium]
MSDMTKIVVIGAGSAQFSLVLVRDLCLTVGLHNSTVTLVDIDQSRLDMTYQLARRYADEMGVNINFEKEYCRKKALENAQFVINIAFQGGFGEMEKERLLLERQGYYRGIGVHAPYRQLELMLEIARDIELICPDAYLLQCSNPLVEGCTLITRETKANVIGLCHGHFDYRAIAEALNLDLESVVCEAIGLNHCIWMTDFRYKSEDAYPLLDEWIKNKSERYWQEWQPTCGQIQMSPAAIDLYRLYGLMPIGDTCRASWPEAWWYHKDHNTKKRWWGPLGGFDGEEGWKIHLEEVKQALHKIQNAVANPNKKLTEVFPPEKSFEQIVYIIDSIVNDRRDIYQVNIPNHGVIKELPDDFVIEVPAVIDGSGIRSLMVKSLPEEITLGVIVPRWLYAERIIRAHQTGDKRLLLQSYLSDQRTRSRTQAISAIDALINLPGNEAMRAHYCFNTQDNGNVYLTGAITGMEPKVSVLENFMEPLVSVVVPSYNSISYIQNCIDSLISQNTKIPYEIIVVDSSTDGTDQLIDREFPHVKLFHFDHQVRVGAARNIGVEKARGRILLFIDTDCVAPATWIEEMYSGFRDLGADGVSGCFENGTPWDVGGCVEYYLEFFRFISHKGEAYSSPFLLGGNSGYKKEVFNSVRYKTDVSFGSDYLLSWPLAQQGRTLKVLPFATVKHSNTTGFVNVLRKQYKIGVAACDYRTQTSPELIALFKRFPFLVFLLPFAILPWIGMQIIHKRGIPEFGKYLLLTPFLFVANYSWSMGFHKQLTLQSEPA